MDTASSNWHGDSGSPSGVNAQRLLWAGFMAILAAGVGFAIRGGILDNWGKEYGLTAGELGNITGQGFTGFCFGIIIGGVIADRIGYGKLVFAAFLLHVLSAAMTFLVTKDNASSMLTWSSFIFALANGTLEAVANPLVATLFPKNRAHYLNILHASWPAGLVLGSAAGWILDDKMKVDWKLQMALYLVPTLIYGLMFLGQRMPRSEASEKGVSTADMFKDVGILGGLLSPLPVLRRTARTATDRFVRYRRSTAPRDRVHHQVLDRQRADVHPVHHPRAGRRGRTGH